MATTKTRTNYKGTSKELRRNYKGKFWTFLTEMIEIGNIFNECDTALGEVMTKLYHDRPDYFLLFLSQAEYNPAFKNIEGVSLYMTDYSWDFHINHYQRNYIVNYLNRNYKKPGYSYSEENIDDLVTELMIYSNVWEDVCFLKFLMRLAQLIDGKDYVWVTDLEYHTELYETIHNEIIAPLKNQHLHLGKIIESAYSSNVRNAFSHSMYSIYVDSREIQLWGGRSKERSWRQKITFDEFQEKFLMTIRIWNMLFHLIAECRECAAKDKLMTRMIPIEEGKKKMQIWAEMRKRGDNYEPCFIGQVINSKKDNK